MINHNVKLCDVTVFSRPNCKIKDPQRVEEILNEIIKGGFKRLQIVSDFDFTITKHTNNNGNQVWSTFCMLSHCKSLPDSYNIESDKLLSKYKPIELDPAVPVEEKIQEMVNWWTASGRLLRGLPLNEEDLNDVAALMTDALKDGIPDLFIDMNKANVPILVFSAGLGNSVLAVLKRYNLYLPNIKVISNFLQYKDGILNGIDEGNIIHTFNKNETAIKGTDYYDLVHDRDHIIVMGDSIGDAGMANGVPSSSHVLKIGFLFEHIEQNLPIYMDAFDIVLIGDETMDVPRAIISLIN